MKKIFISFVLITFTISCFSERALIDPIYYIYVKTGDKLYQKNDNGRYTSINYLCNCYAKKNNLYFERPDTSETFVKDALPNNYSTMQEFAQIANQIRVKSKNIELFRSKIYVIESTKSGKYQYYKVHFQTIENEE